MTADLVNIIRGDDIDAHELGDIRTFKLFWPPADQAEAKCSCGKKLSRISFAGPAFAREAIRGAFVSHCADMALAESEGR